MFKIKRSLIATILPTLVLSLLISLASCTSGGSNNIDEELEGEITIMMWSGDGSYLEDIGHKVFTAEELFGQNQAAAYATARAFNQIYPNVKINIFAKRNDPNKMMLVTIILGTTYGRFQNESMENIQMLCCKDLPGDIKRYSCDLSRFKDDPMYKNSNPGS